jgi:hypothetical protein
MSLQNVLAVLAATVLLAGCASSNYELKASRDLAANPGTKPAAAPAVKPAVTPAAKPAEAPAAKPAEAPAAKPAAAPVAKPAEAPAAKPAEAPAAEPAAKPAEAPVAKPAPEIVQLPPPEGTDGMKNLAQDAKVTASSTQAKFEGEGPAEAVVDGKHGTRWSSEYADKQQLTVDLGAAKALAKLRLLWETASAKAYTVSVSTDGEAWQAVSEQKSDKAGARVDLIDLKDVSARYVRLDLLERSTEFGFSLYEVEVWGKE